MGTIWKISEIILGHIWLFLAGTLKPSKGIPIHSKTKILGPIKIFMLRGRQKLESFNNNQNVFKERARRVSLSFHNPLQHRKQPAFTSPLSARLFQPPNARQWQTGTETGNLLFADRQRHRLGSSCNAQPVFQPVQPA